MFFGISLARATRSRRFCTSQGVSSSRRVKMARNRTALRPPFLEGGLFTWTRARSAGAAAGVVVFLRVVNKRYAGVAIRWTGAKRVGELRPSPGWLASLH